MLSISGLTRTPALNSCSCSAMYTAFCPAIFGHCTVVLLPLGPWQAEQVVAFSVPASTVPSAKGVPCPRASAAVAVCTAPEIKVMVETNPIQPAFMNADMLIRAPRA
jgi:hypothetical protein